MKRPGRRSGGSFFRLSPPRNITFFICLALIAAGVALHCTNLSAYSFWPLTIGGILLLLGCLCRGL